ncbi:hypothetical protein HMI56_001618 [Coelomomyces lativittatus]|nr:hypothetical protein HMI56_001618 [Coelomomyces lativittatus]
MKLIYRVYKEVSRIHVPDATQKWLEDVISKPHPEYTPSSLCKPTFSQCFMPGGLLSFETNASDSKRKRK